MSNLNYQFLLLTHLICADQQIHSEETKALRQLAKEANIEESTLAEMEKLIAQDEGYLSVKDVASKIPPGQQNEAMRQILSIAYIDGFFTPLERKMVEQIAQIWNWSPQEIDKIIEEAEGFKPQTLRGNDEQEELSFAARFLQNEYKSPLSRAVIHFAKKLAPETISRKVEKIEREILLAGPEYNEAIEQCAKIAKEDYEYAEIALEKTKLALYNLAKNLQQTIQDINHKNSSNGKATSAKEVAKTLEASRQALTAEIIKEIESLRESLRAKQRALNHFSIAFMGKTKAGKSTLHAIVTQEGWEAIGVGKQRTTRLNRVYEWKNIRIIDTPGIGAPGGKTDEEIAESVIEEADVICYVVTNDSIQETEFQFMKLLKEKTKPLIILLNVKYNLRDSRRLERFLNNPNKLFEMEGESGLSGHIERIYRYAREHYANDYFSVIPVMLIAAQLSNELEHRECNEKLFKASRIQDFLDSIRESCGNFKSACDKFDKLLAQGDIENLIDIRQKLNEDLKVYREDGILRVAFVGQYSAGKSTIISALTGRRDIKIDADIATDTTTSYNWNGIKLIDTPGLFTERQDHDAITYEAINKADLLVFCLTYMLFDSVTVENFKKLAYEKGYRWKMMLAINKMSDEAGEEEEKIGNYRQSLTQALKPYSFDEFPVSFIDAKDYCNGIDENDDFLLEISRFSTFIDELNKFVERRASLARFDTPVRIALSYIDEAQLSFTRNSTEDSAYFEILNQLSRKVRNERSCLRTKVQSIALQVSSDVAKEGTIIATAVGSNENFEQLKYQAELNIQKHYETAETKLQTLMNTAVEDIRQEVAEVLKGNLVQSFITCLKKTQNVSANNIDAEMDIEILKSQVNWIKSIGERAGVELPNLATRGVLKTASESGFLRSVDVVGSNLYRSVYNVGKFIGFDFKPWQAVNMAKNIANAMKFVGPALAVASVVIDYHAMEKEKEQEQKLADTRRDITSQFIKIAKDLENQIEIQLYEFEAQVYGEIEKQIAEARKQQEELIAASNTWMKKLIEVRQDFELILQDIAKMSVNSVI